MTADTRFRIETPKIVHETFEDETVIINFDSGSYYSLDKVGTHIWSLIDRGATLDQIIDSLARSYRGSRAEIASAVGLFTTELQEQHLVSPTSAASPSRPETSSGEGNQGSSPERPPFQAPALQEYTDMQELLLLDPIHEVDETGWPNLPEE